MLDLISYSFIIDYFIFMFVYVTHILVEKSWGLKKMEVYNNTKMLLIFFLMTYNFDSIFLNVLRKMTFLFKGI